MGQRQSLRRRIITRKIILNDDVILELALVILKMEYDNDLIRIRMSKDGCFDADGFTEGNVDHSYTFDDHNDHGTTTVTDKNNFQMLTSPQIITTFLC